MLTCENFANNGVEFRQALAELESAGMAKCLFNKDTGKVLGVHIIGLHASDLIQVCVCACVCVCMCVCAHVRLCARECWRIFTGKVEIRVLREI